MPLTICLSFTCKESYAKAVSLECAYASTLQLTMVWFCSGFVHFDYVKLIWEHIDHDKMSLKARVVEGGYLGKHVNPTLVYNAQIMDGPEPNTSITKWTFEYDDAHEDTIGIFAREEVSMFGEYLESHINDANPSQIA